MAELDFMKTNSDQNKMKTRLIQKYLPRDARGGVLINPIRTKGGRLCLPYYYVPPNLFGRCGVSAANMFQLLKQDENKDEDALKIQLLKIHVHEF